MRGTDGPQAPVVTFDTGDLPDLTPLAGGALVVLSLLIALAIAGSVSSAWETILLWIHRVPYSATASVADPIFGRDIGFFMFELPFLRLVQGVFNGHRRREPAHRACPLSRRCARAAGSSSRRRSASTWRCSAGCSCCRSPSATSSTSSSCRTATRGIATGVSFTDQNAQFLAYDILTIVSGLAAALLVGGAFTRMIWPLGLTIAVWFLASIVVGRLYPEAVQRFTVTPNQYAQEQRYIGNNIAMTRLAFDLEAGRTSRSTAMRR